MNALSSIQKPWEQWPGESAKAYAAFFEYLGQGTERTTEAVAKKFGKSHTIIGRWCTRFQWIARCDAYAKRMIEVETEKMELARADLAIDWGKRQRELRELEHATALKGIEVVKKWVSQFATQKRIRMKAHEAAKLLDVCSRVGRLSSGLATNRDEISGIDGEPIRVEVAAAIAKVYGPSKTVIEVEVEGKNGNIESSEIGTGQSEARPGTEPTANG